MNKYSGNWSIDRCIPLALIVTLLCQLGAALVWATQINERMAQVEIQSSAVAALSERLARIEERIDNVRQDTQMVKRLLSRLTEKDG